MIGEKGRAPFCYFPYKFESLIYFNQVDKLCFSLIPESFSLGYTNYYIADEICLSREMWEKFLKRDYQVNCSFLADSRSTLDLAALDSASYLKVVKVMAKHTHTYFLIHPQRSGKIYCAALVSE